MKYSNYKRKFTFDKRYFALLPIVAVVVGFGGYYAVANALVNKNAPVAVQGQTGAAEPASSGAHATINTSQPGLAITPQTTPATATVTNNATPTPKSTTTAPVATVPALSKTMSLYAPIDEAAVINQAASQASSDDASVLRRLANQPTARWFGDFSGNVQTAVSNYMAGAISAGRLPVLVAYNIPNRDCGSESSGGAADANAYATWIRQFAAGINGHAAIVIIEPDAVPADCFTSARAAMLADAVNVVQAAGGRAYLDAGNPNWRSTSDIANRLHQAGGDNAAGFSLNVSNFQTTSANVSYGSKISALLSGKHFVIDTSRNGNGPTSDSAWCNPSGRALGQLPTIQTGNSLIDAYLWVKVPGESDGACGPDINTESAPSAGTYWPAYALMLARNAGW